MGFFDRITNASKEQVASAFSTFGEKQKQWYSGESPTRRDILGRIAQIYKKDEERANKLYSDYQYLRNDPTSSLYAPYSQPTSTAVKNLTALGYDTSVFSDEFFRSPEYKSFIATNLEHSGTTGGVKSPTKKSSWQNQVAYYLNMAEGDYQETKKAKEEYNAAMNEAMYLAGNPGWNYSDEKILEKINEDFDTKYPTLAKMKNSGATPVALTEAVDFSDDALLGAMWAARNPEYQGGLEGAMANSYLGKGNVWKEDEKVTSLLNPEDPNYNPFATGSTNMLKAGMTLGQYSFEEGYVQNNQDKYYNGTEAEKEAILWVDKGEQNQQAVDTATTALYGYVNSLLSSGETDSGKVQEAIDTALAGKKLYTYTNKNGEEIYTTKKPSVKNYEEVDLSILNEIDKQCGKTVNGVRSLPVTDPDELLPMTRGTSYKYDSLIPQVTDLCAQNAEILSEADTVNDILGYEQGPINPEVVNTEPVNLTAGQTQVQEPGQIAGNSVQTGAQGSAPGTGNGAAQTPVGTPAGKTLSSPTDLGPVTVNTGAGVSQVETGNQQTGAVGAVQTPVGTPAGSQSSPSDLGSLPIITEADKKQMEEGNKKIREAADTVENVASENEATVMKYAGTISFNPIKNYLTAMRMNPGVMQGIVDKDINTASKAALDSGLKSAHDMAAYDTLKLQNDANVARFNELQAKYGNVEDYNKDIQTGLVKQIGDYTVTLTLDDSDPEKLKYIVSDISSPTMNADYGMIMDQARMEQEDGVSGWASKLIAEAEAQCEPEAKEANRIAAVQTKIAALGEEGTAEINEYKTLNAQIAKENQKLAQDRETYEQAQAELKKTTSKLNMMAETAFILGADSSRVVDAYDFLRDMLNYHDEPQLPMQGATKLEQILSYGEYMGNDYTTAQASEILHQQMENVDERIRQIDQDIAYADKIGYQIPGDYARNIQLKREDLVNEKRALEYSAILTDVDSNEFDNAVNAAKAFEEKYGESSMNYWANLFSSDDFRTLLYNDRYTMDTGDGREAYNTITDEEKDIYYYLLGKKILEMGDSLDEALKNINTNEQGTLVALRKAFSDAAEYERFMEDDQSGYGVWSNREYDQSVEYGRELVESGPLGGTLANIGATMVTPGESIAAALYTFDRLITGGRFSEKSLANRLTGFKNETREATRESINEYYQDNPVMKFIANIGYEIYCNRGDSAMNALTFGMLFPEVSNPILNELLGASPMGVTAGLNAAIQAVENGANTNQAWLILGTTFMAETMTEALTRSNIMEALGDTRELNTETLKQFFKEWLTGSGVEEMFGESANDLIENYFNRGAAEWFDNPNFESDHQKLIDKYFAEGYTGDGEAETKAYEEELKGIAHTAFVSYLSAGADVMTKAGRTALNTVKTAADVVNGYRGYTKAQQKMGYGESMLDYMARDLKNRNKTNTPASAQEAGAAAAKQLTADQVRAAGDVATLQRVEGSTPVTQTEALASILDNGDGGDAVSERANAAATFLMRIMGKDANDTVQKVMNGVSKTDISREAVTMALQNAALGNGAATVLVKSEAFKNASNEQKARMLADTVQQDQTSQAVQQNIMATVKDYRRAVGINELAANGHFDQANADRAAANAATKDVAKAQTALDEKEQALEQAVEDAQQKADAVANDPSDINKKEHQDAVTNVNAADESRKQYEQHLANEQEKKDTADAKAQKSAEDAMTTAREQSAQEVDQVDQQRNEKEQYRQALIDNGIIDREYDTHSGAVDLFASEEEMQARENANFSYDNSNGDVLLTGDVSENVKQMLEDAGFSKREGYNADTGESGEYYVINQNNISPDQLKVINDAINAEKAQMKAEEDERTGKAEEDRSIAAINAIADDERLEGAEREQRIDALTDQNEKVKFRLRDLKSSVSTPEGYLALGALERKLGIKIELADLGEIKPEGWTRGQYVYDKDTGIATIRINKNMKVGQALVEACLHEITHSMKNTGAYDSYRNLVLESMFGTKGAADALSLYNSEEGNKSGFTAEIDQMIEDRLKAKDSAFVGKSHDDQVLAAEEEIVADFARMNLAEKDVVQRFMDAGLGGKMRNTLHNINQAIKNFKLTGDERKTAEYLRRAERMYQKAIDEVSKTSVHPDSNQFSIAQFAQSAGMTFNAKTLQLFDKDGKEIDGVVNKVTPEMMNNTPVGMLIDSGLSDVSPGIDENGNRIPSQREAAKDMMAGLMNMVARYKDSNLVWEIGATTLSSTFSALKSNSDPQYKTTVDFGTVCAKTQAIIDTLSQVMLDKVANGEYGGLNRKDIMKVYDAVNKAGLSVPCPVCYVFSRWMGVPSLLGQMSQYQHDYVVTNEDGTIDKKATQKKVDAYIKSAESKYGDAKAINNQKTKLQSKRTKLEEQRVALEAKSRSKSITEEERTNLKKQLDSVLDEMVKLDNQIGEVSAYNWITQALCKKDKSGKFVVDDKFQLTPDEILFDLNRTGEFAGYEKNWAYRNTRGAGMGKAIMPYSGETIGDILYGVKKGGRQSSIKNPWLNLDGKAAARQLRDAQARARKQNLVGGQRLQSTSDFRPEWGLDYIMSFLELQAAGSKVQMYTKVAEAVDLFASVGADVNLSIMGKGTGWHEATAEEIAAMSPEQRERATIDGKVYVLDFSDVTGMNYGTAVDLKNKYNNVQMILVGMNDTHIRLAMANSDIDFIIPWHSSGNSKDVLAGLISAVGEKLDSSVDYTTTQSDMVKGTVKKYKNENGETVEYTVPGKQTESEKALWDARMKLLTKGGEALTKAERKTLLSNPITADLYKRFTQKGVDDDCYGVKLSKEQANQIFPYEYWDTTSTKENADINGKRFVEYCEAMGIVPRFSQFKDDPGYWKLLIDRPMYNNDGSYHSQQVIDVTNARIGDLNEAGQLENSDLPTQAQAKYAPKDPRNPNYEQYTEAQKNAVENAEAAINSKYDDGEVTKSSVFGTMTEADREVMRQTDEDYMDAVARGDMEAAQEDVDFYAEQKGYTEEAFHGTRERFNSFDIDKAVFGNSGYGFYFGDRSRAAAFGGEDMNIIHAYIKPDRIGTPESHNITTEQFENAIQKLGLSPKKTYGEYVDTAEEYVSLRNDWRLAYDLQDWAHWPQWSTVSGTHERMPAREILSILQETLGMDGIRNDNEIVLWDNKLIKSADPVTYDDNGNVIPLNERFTDSTDIRYSTGGELTEADRELMQDNERELNQALVDYGAITQEELAAYQEQVASRPLEGQNPTMSTAQGSAQRAFGDADGMLRNSDEIAGFAKAVVDAQNSYFPDTNSEQINRAIKWIRSLKQTPNSDGYAEAMNAVQKDNFDYRSADGQARMVAVIGLAVARNDTMAQVALADAFNRQGTDLGRALQARKLFKLMTPAGRISTLQKMIDNYNVDLKKNGNQEIKFSDWIYQAAAYADNADDFHKVLAAAANELAEQLPISWKERLNSLRMLSMLANPRTHIRNLVGNALFVPAVGLKNKMGALMEKAFVKKGERTKTLSPVLRSDIREFARQDARAIRDMLTGEAKYDESSLVQKAKNPLGPVLGWMSDINSKALEGEDWLFLRGHYRKALGGWMQANGYTVDQVKNNKKLLEKGRAYAINEAQKATYRDFNGVAQSLNQWARNTKTPGQKVLAFAVNAVLPFKKTPANILKRGIEYSPLGVARGVYNLGKKFLGGDISANQVVDQICSGLSGTAVMALGFLLAGTGAVSCGFDDDDWLEELKGKQKYSIDVNKVLETLGVPKLFGEDVTYTMDWAAPMAMPFFVGASIRNQVDEEGFDLKKSLSSLLTITEPVFNLSMLDGVNTLLKTSSYSSDAPWAQIGAKVLSNYATSYVPSVIGAITKTFFDDTQRKSYVRKEDKEDFDINGVRHYAIEQMENKIPGLSQTNIPVRDVWGNAKVTDLAERIFENFISPGYVEHIQDDPVVNELGRLFDSTKSKYLEPQHAEQSIEGKGLTAEEYDTRDRVHGETQYSMLKELFDNPDYQDITNDDIKVETVQKIYSYADKVARAAVDEEYRYEKQTVGEIIKDAKISNYKSKMMKDIEDGNWEGYADYVELLHEEGVEDTKIKEKIANTYREEWKNAYRDYLESDTQSEKDMYRKKIGNIEDLLEKTGYEYNIYGNGGWKQKVDEQNGTEGEEIEPAEKETPKTNKPLMTLNSPTGRQAAGYIASAGMSDVGSGRSIMPKRPASDADWDQYMDDLDDYWANYDFSRNDPVGQYGQGNIDLNNRQIAQNDDGSISTERSFSFYDERTGKEVLIPLVADGRVLTEEEAIDRYYETGEYLGMFDDWHDADEYAMMLHNRQDWFYNR